MTPRETLLTGAQLLEPVMRAHGFRFRFIEEGRGSGGDFAVAAFVLPDRQLTLHFRQSLGMVTYDAGTEPLEHIPYMIALGVARSELQYPGFSADPLEGFRHLAHDLDEFAAEFLTGDAAVLRASARALMIVRDAKDREHSARAIDARALAEAQRRFRQKDYSAAASLFASVKFPEHLTDAERRLFAIARERSRD
jgi:hypothetical protein